MKFRYISYGTQITYESKAEYFNHRASEKSYSADGAVETLAAKVEYLEEVIGRLLNHTKLNLEQLSDIVDGYDRELEDLDE